MTNTHPLLRLYKYSRHHKRRLYLAFFSSILNKIFDLAPPVLIGTAVDIVVRQEDSILGSIGITNVKTQLYVLGVLTLIIWILESLFDYLAKWFWRNLAQIVEHELRIDAYSHLQELELEYFEDRQTGGLMSILNDDINQLERFLDIGANDIVQVTTTVIVICTAFFVISPEAAIWGILPMPFVLLFSLKFQKFMYPKYLAVREQVSILNGKLSNNLTGISTIKSYTAEQYEVDRITASSTQYQKANSRAIAWSSAFSPLIRMIIVVGFTAMLIFGGIQAVDGNIEAGAYSILIFLTQRLLWPLTRLGETFDQYQRAMASTNRVLNLLDTQPAIKPGGLKLPIENIKGSIQFRDVNFAYKNREPILSLFNVDITPGESVAFVGATGAGKTTLVKMILRFYDPQTGTIFLDGYDIKSLNLQSLRAAVGLVSQDVFLIDGSVKENIIYGKLDADLDAIIEAAKIAEVHDFVNKLPNKYETLVGERGMKLSGGQRQRISIARAVLRDPPILIFDEATSSVDNETEAAIQRSLERITEDRTTIIIAHRLSTIRNVDRIFVLEHGRIMEEGTHDQLVANDGLYASLWRVQTGVRLLEH
ncbi:MAG: ABC transporter ATP-binding protein [Candidatus Kariarchaeaceae archaeon]